MVSARRTIAVCATTAALATLTPGMALAARPDADGAAGPREWAVTGEDGGCIAFPKPTTPYPYPYVPPPLPR